MVSSSLFGIIRLNGLVLIKSNTKVVDKYDEYQFGGVYWKVEVYLYMEYGEG